MGRRLKKIYGISACIAMIIVITSGKDAVNSIEDGITLCLHTVIPALFPFFILSRIMNSCYIGQKFQFMTPVRRICKIPTGAESILIVGFLSGYPVGAKLITDAYINGVLTEKTAKRMLGFCSNAGPAFLFGMLTTAFTRPEISWILWGIHILSALITGCILPDSDQNDCTLQPKEIITLKSALEIATKNIATVCSWVVLFRLILDYLRKYLLFILPNNIQIILFGIIELSNGCIMLKQIENEALRFIAAATMLGFGGICVAMQTVSVTSKLGTGYYFPGKILHALISFALSCILQALIFPHATISSIRVLLVIAIISIITLTYLLHKKSCSI